MQYLNEVDLDRPLCMSDEDVSHLVIGLMQVTIVMKQADLWSGCKLYLLWLAIFIPANYPLTTGRGKSGLYISK